MIRYQMVKKKVKVLNKNIKYYFLKNNKQQMNNYLLRKKLWIRINKQKVQKNQIFKFYIKFLKILILFNKIQKIKI